MVRAFNIYLSLILFVLTSCSGGSKIDVNVYKSGIKNARITNVQVEGNQLHLTGKSLDGVTKLTVEGPNGFKESFSVNSKNKQELFATGSKDINFQVGSLFNFILSDAHGSATFLVDFTLQDGSVSNSKLADDAVTGNKIHHMGASDGDALVYNNGTGQWEARALNGLSLKGSWNANTNIPALASSGANTNPFSGDYYLVSDAGSTLLDGINVWNVGDWVIFNGTTWDYISNSSGMVSFNGRQGIVVPAANDYTWNEIDKTTSDINDIANVDTTGVAAGKILKYDGAKWAIADDDNAGGGAGSVTTTEILDGTVSNDDLAGSIAQAKVINLTTDLAARLKIDGSVAMTGALDMGAQAITNVGNVDGVDVSALKTQSDNNVTAIAALPSLGTSSGDALDIGTVPNCSATQKLQMSAGPTFTLSCVTDYDTDTNTNAANICADGEYLDGDATCITMDKAAVALSNVDNIQQMPLSYLDTDVNLAADSDVKVPSQKAIKAYVDALSTGGDYNNGGDTAGAGRSLGNNDAFDLNLETSNATRLTIKANGRVGVGTTTPGSRLDLGSISGGGSAVYNLRTDIDGGNIGIDSASIYNNIFKNSGSTGSLSGVYNNMNSSFGGNVYGVKNQLGSNTSGDQSGIYNSGSVGSGSGFGVKSVLSTNNDATIEKIYGSYFDGTTYSGSSDESYGSYIKSNASSTGGTQYGVYVDLSAGTATKYAGVFNGGNVGIGRSAPAAKLDVNGIVRATQICDETGANCKDISSGWGSGGSVTSVASGTGLTGGPITGAGTLNVDVGTTANKIVQLDGAAKLPAIDGSQLTNLPNSTMSTVLTGFVTGADSTVLAADTVEVGLEKLQGQIDGNNTDIAALPSLGTASGDAIDIGTIPNCTATQKLQMSLGPVFTISCVTTDKNSVSLGNLDNVQQMPLSYLDTDVNLAADSDVKVPSQKAIKAYVDALGTGGDFSNGGDTAGATRTLGNNDAFDLGVETNSLTRMTIKSDGKVGIGTASPTNIFEVVADNNSIFNNDYDDNSVRTVLSLTRTKSSSSAPNANFGASLDFNLEGFTDGSSTSAGRISSRWKPNQTNDTSARDSYMSFSTKKDNGLIERMRITQDGNIGIGIVSPGAKLEVAGQVKITGGAPGAGKVLTSDAVGLATWTTPISSEFSDGGEAGGANRTLGNTDAFDLGFNTNNTTKMTIKSDGKVGIGTTTPSTHFDLSLNESSGAGIKVENSHVNGKAVVMVENDSALIGQFQSYSTLWMGDTDLRSKVVMSSTGPLGLMSNSNLGSGGADPIDFYVGGYSIGQIKMRLTSGGNLGVGTTTPGAKLEVAGQVKITGGAPGTGKVLTSDAVGLATWETPSASSGDFSNNGDAAGAARAIGNNDAYDLNIETSGANRLTVKADGKIGIGTTAPDTPLHVRNDQNNLTSIKVQNADAGLISLSSIDLYNDISYGGGVSLGSSGNLNALLKNRLALESSAATDGLSVIYGTGNDFRIYTDNANEALRIDSSGNMGLGTISPGAKLEVVGQVKVTGGVPGVGKVLTSDAAGLATWETPAESEFTDGGDVVGGARSLGNNNAHDLSFETTGADRLTILADGKIGVGTSSPTTMFDIKTTGTVPFEVKDASNDSMVSIEADGSINMVARGNITGSMISVDMAPSIASGDFAYFKANRGLNYDFRLENTHTSGTLSSSYRIANADATISFDYVSSDNGRLGFTGEGTEHMSMLTNTGYIGIGTVTPSTELEVAGQVKITGGVPGAGKVLTSDAAGLATWETPTTSEFSDGGEVGGAARTLGNTDAFDLGFNTNNTTKMTIKSDGKVGIGETNPTFALHVSTGTTQDGIKLKSTVNAGAVFLDFEDDDGGRATIAMSDSGFVVSEVSNSLYLAARNGKNIVFATDPDTGINSGSNFTTITNAGDFGIGTTAPSEKLHVVGNLRVQGTTDCVLGGGSGATNCTSDRRLKNNITPIGNAKDKLFKISGVDFDWNEKSLSEGTHSIGVIAQDVQSVFPTAVIENSESGYLMVDYAVLVSPIIEAMKEIDTEVTYNLEMFNIMQGTLKIQQEMIGRNTRQIASIKAENRELKETVKSLSKSNELLMDRLEAIEARLMEVESSK